MQSAGFSHACDARPTTALDDFCYWQRSAVPDYSSVNSKAVRAYTKGFFLAPSTRQNKLYDILVNSYCLPDRQFSLPRNQIIPPRDCRRWINKSGLPTRIDYQEIAVSDFRRLRVNPFDDK